MSGRKKFVHEALDSAGDRFSERRRVGGGSGKSNAWEGGCRAGS